MTIPARARLLEPERNLHRQQLREAITRYNLGKDRRDKTESALDTVRNRVWAAAAAVERAEEALKEAQEAAPAALVESLIEGTSSATPAVTEAEAALTAAEKTLAETRRHRQMLEQELQRREVDLGYDKRDVDNAICLVVGNSAELQKLLLNYRHARHTMERAANALRGLILYFKPEDKHWDAVRADVLDDLTLRNEWEAIIKALENNADAPLPGSE
jgi:hypothetical protein